MSKPERKWTEVYLLAHRAVQAIEKVNQEYMLEGGQSKPSRTYSDLYNDILEILLDEAGRRYTLVDC